jgi:hypothetical protein
MESSTAYGPQITPWLLLVAALTSLTFSIFRDSSLHIYRDDPTMCPQESEARDATRIELITRNHYLIWVSCSAPGKL